MSDKHFKMSKHEYFFSVKCWCGKWHTFCENVPLRPNCDMWEEISIPFHWKSSRKNL